MFETRNEAYEAAQRWVSDEPLLVVWVPEESAHDVCAEADLDGFYAGLGDHNIIDFVDLD